VSGDSTQLEVLLYPAQPQQDLPYSTSPTRQLLGDRQSRSGISGYRRTRTRHQRQHPHRNTDAVKDHRIMLGNAFRRDLALQHGIGFQRAAVAQHSGSWIFPVIFSAKGQ
jgi:hypothetical protein